MDDFDRKILRILQVDASQPIESIGEQVGLSRNACWRRIKALEDTGIVTGRIALVDASKVGAGLSAFIMIRTSRHEPEWIDKFNRADQDIPEIVGVYRTSGDIDYIVRARIADMADYDRLYLALIRKVSLTDVSATFVMEDIKETFSVPV
jgi:Lrp/AsnC family transcriptional regulator